MITIDSKPRLPRKNFLAINEIIKKKPRVLIMNNDQFEAFSESLDIISEQYKQLSFGAKMLYWNCLKEYELETVQEALYRHIKNPDTGMFMPKIADIERMIKGSTRDSAMIAWSKVDRAVRHVGTYSDVVFDDLLIHRVLHDMGGWVLLGNKKNDEWPFVAREFENRYRGFRERSEVPEYPRLLVGIANAANSAEGMPIEKPVFIGNLEECKMVLSGGSGKSLIGFSRVGDGVAALAAEVN